MAEKLDDTKPDDHDVIYTLRTAHQSQTQLNVMADQKANIIVGAIIIFLSFLVTRYSSIDLADTPLVIFLLSIIILELVALLLAIMVIKPRTKWANHSLKIDSMPNPLFFGFFSQFKEQEYINYMQHKLKDNHSARELLLKDIYQIGQVLKRKYTLLKLAYNFAAAGILLAAIGICIKLFLQ